MSSDDNDTKSTKSDGLTRVLEGTVLLKVNGDKQLLVPASDAAVKGPEVGSGGDGPKVHSAVNNGKDLKSLNGKHREVMRRLGEGATQMQIAEQMGVSLDALSLICNSPLFRDELDKVLEKKAYVVADRLEDLANEALDNIKGLMRNARSEMVKKGAAESILDRAGYSRLEKKQLFVTTGEDVIKELNRKRAEEAKDVTPPPSEAEEVL